MSDELFNIEMLSDRVVTKFKNFFRSRTVIDLIVIETYSNLQCLPEKVVNIQNASNCLI